MNPFEREGGLNANGTTNAAGKEEDQMSMGEEDQSSAALMRADLEVSPMVMPTPPVVQAHFVARATEGPALPRSIKDQPTMQLSPKKRRRPDQAVMEQSFTQVSGVQRRESNQASGNDPLKKRKFEIISEVAEASSVRADGTAKKEENPVSPAREKGTTGMSDGKMNAPTSVRGVASKGATSETSLPLPLKKSKLYPFDAAHDLSAEVSKPPLLLPPKAKVTDNAAAGKSATSQSTSVKSEPPKKERKRAPKPVRRILIARKETDVATTFIKDWTDLRDYLTSEDCQFLAETFWIFTKEHLKNVLNLSASGDRAAKSLEITRAKVVDRLAEKYYFDRNPEERKTFHAQQRKLQKAEEMKVKSRVPDTQFYHMPYTTVPHIATKQAAAEATTAGTTPSDVAKPTPAQISAGKQVGKTSDDGKKEKSGDYETGEGNSSPAYGEKSERSNPFNMPEQATNGQTLHALPPAAMGPLQYEIPKIYVKKETRGNVVNEDDIKRGTVMETVEGPKEECDISKAEEKVNMWSELLNKMAEITSVEKRFPLAGPVSVLIPEATRNFFITIKMEHLFDFLSTRRTETGAICDMMRIFRKECDLPYLNHLAISRHLMGLSTRIERVLGATLPIDEGSRRWMSGSLIVCTGAANEFIIKRLGMNSSWQFLESKTKSLSIELAKWREANGLPALKGSGKVAMVSAWKAMLREENDAMKSPGKVLTDIDILEVSSKEIPIVKDETNNCGAPAIAAVAIKNKPKEKAPPPGNLEFSTQSALFIEHCLGKETADFLSTLKINSAADLNVPGCDARIVEGMIAAKMAATPADCLTMIMSWRARVHYQLGTVGPYYGGSRKPKAAAPKKAALKPTELTDPFHALSAVTKRFLTSVGINTGEQFLSQRTTEIAEKFVVWRLKEGMPELKGLGSIASVSGWKATCRKAASDMGLHDIAATEPEVTASWSLVRRKKGVSGTTSPPPKKLVSVGSRDKVTLKKLPCFSDLDDKEILQGRTRVEFSVARTSAPFGRFQFELSIRKKTSAQSPSFYLTFKGAFAHADRITSNPENVEIYREGSDSKRFEVLPKVLSCSVASNSSFDHRQPFSSLLEGCGLIDLRSHGVCPHENCDLSVLKDLLVDFVSGKLKDIPSTIPKNEPVNVVTARDVDGMKQYLFLPHEMEKGQTVPLKFPSLSAMLSNSTGSPSKDMGLNQRTLVDTALSALSQSDLRKILRWMEGIKNKIEKNLDSSKPGDQVLPLRKLHWIARRAVSMLQSPKDADNKLTAQFSFGEGDMMKCLASGNVSPEQTSIVSLKAEWVQTRADEVLALLEHDPLCGSQARENWFELARERFPLFLKGICDVLFADVSEEEDLGEKVKSVLEKFRSMGRPSLAVLQLDENRGEPRLACIDPDAIQGSPVFRPFGTVLVKYDSVSLSWYRDFLSEIALKVFTAFQSMQDEEQRVNFADAKSLCSTSKFTVPQDLFSTFTKRVSLPKAVLLSESLVPCLPASYQFFLGIVWPALREQRWRLETGETPDDVSFTPPKIGKLKRSNRAKNEGNRKRQRLARDVDKIGWGHVGKLTQRIMLKCDEYHSCEKKPLTITTEEAIQVVLQWVEKHIPLGDEVSRDRIVLVGKAIRECYNSLAPFMAKGLGWKPQTKGDVSTPALAFGAETLMQFLLLLPSILRHSSLPLQQISDCFQVVREFVDVFTKDCKTVLSDQMQPTAEEYSDESVVKNSSLANRLKLLVPKKEENGDKDQQQEKSNLLTEIILPEDKVTSSGDPALSDFVITVMEQVIPIRATDADAEKKYRRIHVGYPGMSCRHCLGVNGEGRYFFSSLESLSTASTVLEKHLMRCPAVPNNVKGAIATARQKHSSQRKLRPQGGQQAFFNKLWDRLRSGEIGGDAPNIPNSSNRIGEGEQTREDDNESMGDVFQDHVQLLNFVRTTSPWKNNRSVQSALNKYYSCLDYGGRIYQTPSMPKHFSSEWLLAKVVPKRYEYPKLKYLPG